MGGLGVVIKKAEERYAAASPFSPVSLTTSAQLCAPKRPDQIPLVHCCNVARRTIVLQRGNEAARVMALDEKVYIPAGTLHHRTLLPSLHPSPPQYGSSPPDQDRFLPSGRARLRATRLYGSS